MYRANHAPVTTGHPHLYFNKSIKNRRRQKAQATKYFAVGTNRSLYGSLVWTLMGVAFLAPPPPFFLKVLLGFSWKFVGPNANANALAYTAGTASSPPYILTYLLHGAESFLSS